MTDITIPRDTLEKAARAAYAQWVLQCAAEDNAPVEDWLGWEELENDQRQTGSNKPAPPASP